LAESLDFFCAARLILYGGWSDEWLCDLYSLDVSGIVGPPYAVQMLEPANGPITGNTFVTIRGLNFDLSQSTDHTIKVKFISG
jgi:dynein heavy chain